MSVGILHKFYCSKAWRDLCFNLKIERGCTCCNCGKVYDTSYLIGHHTIELTEENVNEPSISLNPELIEIKCFDCHNKEHKRFGYHSQKVFIVYGSPMSGKSTAVRQLAGYGDIVLDIDNLWEAVTLQARYIKPDNIRFNVFALRDALLDQIKTRYGNWNNAYIIGGYADKYKRERTAKELGAELIYIESTKEECLQRLKDSKKPNVWQKYLDEWWSQYTA